MSGNVFIPDIFVISSRYNDQHSIYLKIFFTNPITTTEIEFLYSMCGK